MTTREELRRIVETVSEEHATELLDYARWLEQEGEALTEAEIDRVVRGEEQLRRGDSVSWEDLRRDIGV